MIEFLFIVLIFSTIFILEIRIRISQFIWYWFFYKKTTNIQEAKKQLNTPFKVQSFLTHGMKYKKDETRADEWLSAEETFKRRASDCEDYAVFADFCLKDTKYAGKFLCMYGKSKGHATYLIRINHTKYVTIGTFGLINHYVDDTFSLYLNIADWLSAFGYSDWKKFVIKRSDKTTIQTFYNEEE